MKTAIMKPQISRKCWLMLASAFLNCCSFGGIVIGYTNTLQVPNFSQRTMGQVAQLNCFFAHASVGENLMSGIQKLHSAEPTFYSLQRGSVSNAPPPAATFTGFIYDLNRGNPGWQAKIDLFAASVSNGWRYPKVNIVMNKFCWIDPDADLNYYINSMSALEAAYPETCFVYATIPLTPQEDRSNYRRALFNDSLRSWIRSSARLLYDIADMEAHDTNGLEQTFVYEGYVCQKQFSGYTDDGGHLTTAGGQKMAAAGFYALGAALLSFDRDADGMPDLYEVAHGFNPVDPEDGATDADLDGGSNLQEFLAGTDPRNPASVFRIAITRTPDEGVAIRFIAASNVAYKVQFTPQATTLPWQTITNIASAQSERQMLLPGPGLTLADGLYRVLAWR